MIAADDERAVALDALIRRGDVDGLAALLAEHPELATERFGDDSCSRTALHLATDWPGNWPRVAESIALLVSAGAPVDGRMIGPHAETPLHWAASSDDVAALDALVAAGADLEADGAVLTGGTPLADAVVFAQWRAAQRLVEYGAAKTIWQAAAVGDVSSVVRLAATASADDITNAGWHACRAGRLDTARVLADRGANLEWVGHNDLTPRQAGIESGADDLIAWLATR